MSERSISIFVIDIYPASKHQPAELEIEEYRTFTTEPTATYDMLKEESFQALALELWENSSREYYHSVLAGLDQGKDDFTLDLGKGATSRIVVVRDTEATSFLVNTVKPNPFGIQI